jgi:hypothetical protein
MSAMEEDLAKGTKLTWPVDRIGCAAAQLERAAAGLGIHLVVNPDSSSIIVPATATPTQVMDLREIDLEDEQSVVRL